MIRRLPTLLLIPALVAGMSSSQAHGQGEQIPFVTISPVETSSDGPNAGQWFVADVSPGQTVRLHARITNPVTTTEQTVRLYLADLEFNDEGVPQLQERSQDVGTWGGFDQSEIVVPPDTSLEAPFSLTAPEGVEPGDHVGAVVAESVPQGQGSVPVIKRVVTRLYATVPGDAVRSFTVEDVTTETDSFWFPSEVTVTTVLRNTGRIRLQPDVRVNDQEASGSDLLLTKSVEPYISTHNVPFWGLLQRYRVDITTRAGDLDGPSRQVRVSAFVIPWPLLFLLALAVGLFFGGRWVWRKRGSKYDVLQSDIRRLERLLSGVAAGQQGTEDSLPGGRDPETAIRGAIKQARRAGDEETVRRLEAKLDEVRGTPPEEVLAGDAAADANPAVAAILRDIAGAPPKRQGALIQAARAYGIKELRKHQSAIDELPDEVRLRLLARKSPAKPSSGKKGRPAKRKR